MQKLEVKSQWMINLLSSLNGKSGKVAAVVLDHILRDGYFENTIQNRQTIADTLGITEVTVRYQVNELVNEELKFLKKKYDGSRIYILNDKGVSLK